MDGRLTIDQLNDAGCMNMLCAMVKLLAKDFRHLHKALMDNPDDVKAYRRYRNCRKIFLSDYFSELTNLNGMEIVSKLEAEIA